jgi:hypothetical protein
MAANLGFPVSFPISFQTSPTPPNKRTFSERIRSPLPRLTTETHRERDASNCKRESEIDHDRAQNHPNVQLDTQISYHLKANCESESHPH